MKHQSVMPLESFNCDQPEQHLCVSPYELQIGFKMGPMAGGTIWVFSRNDEGNWLLFNVGHILLKLLMQFALLPLAKVRPINLAHKSFPFGDHNAESIRNPTSYHF